MFQWLREYTSSAIKSGLSITAILAIILLSAHFLGLYKSPYLISSKFYSQSGGKLDCDESAISYINESIRVSAKEYAASTNTVRTNSPDFVLPVYTDVDSIDWIYDLSAGNSFLLAIRNFLGASPKNIDVFVVADEKCKPVGATVFSEKGKKYVKLDNSEDLRPISIEVVSRIDDFIPIAKMAFAYSTTAEARRLSFIKISEGSQTKWFKNLVAFTYLKETDLFDGGLNPDMRNDRLNKAEYWVKSALSEDEEFIPAVVNSYYIDIEKNKHSYNSYEEAIRGLMNLHYRGNCHECVSGPQISG